MAAILSRWRWVKLIDVNPNWKAVTQVYLGNFISHITENLASIIPKTNLALWLNPSGAETGRLWTNQINSVTADALASRVPRASAAMLLAVYGR